MEGTRNALLACRQAGVGRFVHVGTEAALLDGHPLVRVDESAPLRPDSRTSQQGDRHSKARRELGYEPVIAVEEGLAALSAG